MSNKENISFGGILDGFTWLEPKLNQICPLALQHWWGYQLHYKRAHRWNCSSSFSQARNHLWTLEYGGSILDKDLASVQFHLSGFWWVLEIIFTRRDRPPLFCKWIFMKGSINVRSSVKGSLRNWHSTEIEKNKYEVGNCVYGFGWKWRMIIVWILTLMVLFQVKSSVCNH